MPQIYQSIKDKAVQQGMPLDQAKTKAAKIYNWIKSKHPSMQKLSNKPDKQSNNNAGGY